MWPVLIALKKMFSSGSNGDNAGCLSGCFPCLVLTIVSGGGIAALLHVVGVF